MRERLGEHGRGADDDSLEREFWHDEPTGLHRLLTGLRREPATARPAPPRRRSHRVERQPQAQRRVEPEPQVTADPPSRRAIDPLLARIGAMSLVVAFIVPVAVSLRDDNGAPRLTSAPAPAAPAPTVSLASAQVPDSSAGTTTAPPSTALDPRTLPPATPVYPDPPASTAPASTSAPSTAAAARTASLAATRRACAKSYTVAAGDYWILIAGKVGVTLRELLDANGATTSTPLYPGRSICLPANASPPTTTTVRPTTTTVKPATSTTKPPVTTPPPTTQAPRTYTRAEVQQIIRDVWPDHLEEEALRIAARESNFVPTAKNWCCYGLFQIYWNVHKGWLAGMGVTSATQLFDPVVNARAAYALYQRSNGWGPWRL